MSNTKRAWKLQEFVAHSSNVNCLALGQKTGRVLVTGGEDKKVNLWTVGKPNCVMSLSGHTSAVEAVKFGNNEEMVVAGSISGALKLWDLEQAKIIRTLTGHKANIRCLDFHPYGDFVASGSLDTNVKLWDIRRKGCIFTYKGHTSGVNDLKFSPDGRWVASAGDDNLIKIWDLAAGKLLSELKRHTAPVSRIEFHPSEYLLASGSLDRTVAFWELEKFQCIDVTDQDNSGIRVVKFHPDGECIYGGAVDIVKIYGYEPSRCFDSVNMTWGKIADMAITAQGQLIGASYNQTNVGTYVLDLSKTAPVGQPPDSHVPTPMETPSTASRKLHERPSTTSTKQTVPKAAEQQEESTNEDADDANSTADVQDPSEYERIFKPTKNLTQSPDDKADPFLPPKEDNFSVKADDKAPAPYKNSPAPSYKPAAAPVKPTAIPAEKESIPPPHLQSAIRPNPADYMSPRIEPQDFHQPTPRSYSDDYSALSQINKGHNSMGMVLSARNKNLEVVRAMWTSGNIKMALESAVQMNDQSVIVDILNVLNFRPQQWSLDVAAMLLSHMTKLIISKHESHVHVACMSLKLVLKTFGHLIKQNLQPPARLGVDLSAEDRHRKCLDIYSRVQTIRSSVEGKQYAPGKVGATFKELQLLLTNLDS